MDPKLQQQVQRSQNRIESYHQLRAAIAEVDGKKQLIGKTDIEIGISNQCGRLLANVIIYYNSVLLTKLVEKYQSENNTKVLNFLVKLSPVAYQHIHLLGHYVFNLERSGIDLDAVIAELKLNEILSL